MQVYEHRSLPSDTQAAGTSYQTWLLQSVTEVDLDDANVNATGSHGKEGVYHQLGFTISGRGDLRQLIRFLHKFYSVDYLHRIRRHEPEADPRLAAAGPGLLRGRPVLADRGPREGTQPDPRPTAEA